MFHKNITQFFRDIIRTENLKSVDVLLESRSRETDMVMQILTLSEAITGHLFYSSSNVSHCFSD